MKPVLAMFDNFFNEPKLILGAVRNCSYSDVVNPVDGVTYPGICLEVPELVRETFISQLSSLLGYNIEPNFIFARRMPEGVKNPHQVHSDISMGKYSAHVYVNLLWPEGAGTGFYSHETEGHQQTFSTKIENLSYSGFDKWSKTLFCQGKYNRCLIHDASFFHCAEPAEGFGQHKYNARTVLTCFFN